MGYTNYMWQSRDLTREEWATFCARVREIFAATDVPLANWAGVEGTAPTISDELVSFNGVGPDGCETCCVTRRVEDDGFSFTKTCMRPYDAVVIAVYSAACDVAPGAFDFE